MHNRYVPGHSPIIELGNALKPAEHFVQKVTEHPERGAVQDHKSIFK